MIEVIGILGAGKLGTVLSQLAIRAGYQVYIAGSGSPDKIALSVSVLSPGAVATTTQQAIAKSDVVILALPLGKYRQLPAEKFDGKLVVDAMNYWWEVDGDAKELLAGQSSSSQIVQAYLKSSRLIKALSHMGYHNLLDDAKPDDDTGRKAIAIAGDNPDDKALVAQLVRRLGFEPVDIGRLAAGKQLEPGSPVFGASTDAASLKQLLGL